MSLVPGALVRVKALPGVDGAPPNKDVMVFDARDKKLREFLPDGTEALVIGIMPEAGTYPLVYLFVANKGFYRTVSRYLDVIWSPNE